MAWAVEVDINPKITRRHNRKKPADQDFKGERFFLQGKRWRFPSSLSTQELETRISRLRALWQDHESFCRKQVMVDPGVLADLPFGEIGLEQAAEQLRNQASKGSDKLSPAAGWPPFGVSGRSGGVVVSSTAQWTPLALWIAEQIKLGVQPLPLPPLTELLSSVYHDHRIDYRFGHLAPLVDRTEEANDNTAGLRWQDALRLLNRLSEAYPSVPWTMSQRQIEEAAEFHEQAATEAIVAAAKVRSQKPTKEKILRIAGTFHEALREYAKKRTADFTKGGEFDGSGHQMLGLIENFQKRQPNIPLAILDFTHCQEIFDFWRNRPLNLKSAEPLSFKHCTTHIGELQRFFKWLHTSDKFAWRRPTDFDLLETKVKRLPSDRKSIQEIEIKTFSIEHLKLLYTHALPPQRLKILWCLNCAHGAAEIGRVEWEDLFLHQPHPWTKDGLKIDSSDRDSWCGLLRPKTDVVGWWWLWPETVQLIQWWQTDLKSRLKRELRPFERMLLTEKGTNLYRDSCRNAQSSFSNEWRRLLCRLAKAEGKEAVPQLPFGTLRDQMSNWLGGEQNQAVIASVALAHGIPHKGDALLFKHYSNRPWAHLFAAQKEYRQLLQPLFDAVPDPLVIHDPLMLQIRTLWNSGERSVTAIAQACDVSLPMVHRLLRDFELT